MTRCFCLAALLALAACGDDPTETPTVPAPGPSVEADTPLGPEPREVADQIPDDSVVTPGVPQPEQPEAPVPPAAPPSAERPAPERPAPERPAPERPSPERPAPPPPAPEPPAPQPPAPGADRSEAEAFWTRFQGALRARDAGQIDDFLHTTVRVGGQDYERDGPQVQEVVRQFTENPDLADAYLDTSADQLQVQDAVATFSSRARYTVEGEPVEVTVFGTIREIAPGTWRITELGSRE